MPTSTVSNSHFLLPSAIAALVHPDYVHSMVEEHRHLQRSMEKLWRRSLVACRDLRGRSPLDILRSCLLATMYCGCLAAKERGVPKEFCRQDRNGWNTNPVPRLSPNFFELEFEIMNGIKKG